MLSLLGITIATFIGTALDNLLILVVLQVSGTPRREIATLQVASSFDTLAAFLPLFADTVRPQGLVIAGGFVLMSFAWLLAARALARTPSVTGLMVAPGSSVSTPATVTKPFGTS